MRKINENKSDNGFQFQGTGVRSLSRQLGVPGGTLLDRTSFHLRATHSHPHSLRMGKRRHGGSPHVHVPGMWEDTGVPGGNPRRPGETCKPHTDSGPARKRFCVSHQHCNKTPLSQDVLYTGSQALGLETHARTTHTWQ